MGQLDRRPRRLLRGAASSRGGHDDLEARRLLVIAFGLGGTRELQRPRDDAEFDPVDAAILVKLGDVLHEAELATLDRRGLLAGHGRRSVPVEVFIVTAIGTPAL